MSFQILKRFSGVGIRAFLCLGCGKLYSSLLGLGIFCGVECEFALPIQLLTRILSRGEVCSSEFLKNEGYFARLIWIFDLIDSMKSNIGLVFSINLGRGIVILKNVM